MYSEAVDYFYDKCLHIYPGFANVPGYQCLRGVRETMDARSHGVGGYGEGTERLEGRASRRAPSSRAARRRSRSGCASTARTCASATCCACCSSGNLDRERTMYNVKLFAEKVLPNLRDVWDGEWEDKWWINPLSSEQRAPLAAK